MALVEIRILIVIAILLCLTRQPVFAQGTKSDSTYFPLELFLEVEYAFRYKDSSSTLISSRVYSFEGKIDTFRTYAKVIPGKFDTSQVRHFSQFLQDLREPVLFNKTFNKEVYRFLWLRTFNHPVAIRLEKDDHGYTVIWKV